MASPKAYPGKSGRPFVPLCPKIEEGWIPGVESMTELNALLAWFKGVAPKETSTWAPYTDIQEEDAWRNLYSGELMNREIFTKGQPNGGWWNTEEG